MITTKQKWIATAVFAACILLFTALSLFKPKQEAKLIYEDAQQLKGRKISGVTTKTPDSSAKIFLDSYFGVNFGQYLPFDDLDTALASLQNRKVSAVWVTDVSAKYYTRTGPYRALSPAETPGMGQERFEFAFAFRKRDTAFRDKTNEMIANFKENGIIDRLYADYVEGREQSARCSLKGNGSTIVVGITGTVPPLEIVDDKGNVSGMAVELSKYLAAYIDRKVKFVVLENETAFAALMAGKVDVIACYGTSENHSTEFPEYIMSDGYCTVKEYSLLVNK